MMQVYHAGSYGRANLMVRPGISEPQNDLWFEMVADEYGELRRRARNILIRFQDGAAEVEDELGRYLLEKEQLVSAEPLPFAAAPDVQPVPGASGPSQEWEEVFALVARKPPIAVGQPMAPEVATSQARWLGEKIRV